MNYQTAPPTDRQISFAEAIAEALDVEPPKEFTKKAYSEFITEWHDDYYNDRNKIAE